MDSTPQWQQRRDTAGLIALLQAADSLQLDVAHCLDGTHINTAAITEPFAQCYSWQELALIRNMQALLPEQAQTLGLLAARHYTAGNLGVLGQGMAACDTLQQAADFIRRYRSFGLCFSKIVIEQRDQAFVIEQLDEGIPDDLRVFMVSRGLAGTLALPRDLVGAELKPQSVLMAIPAPPNADEFNRHFGVAVEFSAGRNCVVLAAETGALALPTANPRNREIFAHYCEEVQSALRDRLSQLDALQELLAQSPDIDAEQAAARLQMSARSLRRTLAQTGHSFRQLQLSVRMQKAKDMLRTGMQVATVAEALGYSETASFSRAYKTHTGVTPQSDRR
jgi:AraC-like DNA-binding protein